MKVNEAVFYLLGSVGGAITGAATGAASGASRSAKPIISWL